MKEFTALEFIQIDIANAFGHDKLPFEERIEWVQANGKRLVSLADQADDYPMYVKACLALRDAVKTGHSRHMVGLDAVASGLQCLSIISGCLQGASQVGLVDPNKRCDPYTGLMGYMNRYIETPELKIGFSPEGYNRQDLKDPFMTLFYQSLATAMKTFGEHEEVLKAFFSAVKEMAPAAFDLIWIMAGAVREDKLEYKWKAFDGFEVVTKVTNSVAMKFSLEEMLTQSGSQATFTHRHKMVMWNPAYRAICANITHSIDGALVREMCRRCNHSPKILMEALEITKGCKVTDRSHFVSLREAHKLVEGTLEIRDENHLGQIGEVICKVLRSQPFPIATIHDDFKTYPQFCNPLRRNYLDILHELSQTNHLQDILRSIYDDPLATYAKAPQHTQLTNGILACNYALC